MVSRREVLAALAGVLGAGGCGLTDYEAQMGIEQQQVQRFDEETKHLGAPLETPKLKSNGKEVDTPDIFFRPPKGVLAEPDSNPGPPPYSRYVARTTAKNTERVGIAEVYLALGAENQKDFVTTAVQALSQLSGVKPRAVTRQPPDREPITFSVYDNGAGFSLYVCQRNGLQLAIGYQSDKTTGAAKAIDLSLESLEVGSRASKLRKVYDQRVRSHR
jgi:hypothetical protein